MRPRGQSGHHDLASSGTVALFLYVEATSSAHSRYPVWSLFRDTAITMEDQIAILAVLGEAGMTPAVVREVFGPRCRMVSVETVKVQRDVVRSWSHGARVDDGTGVDDCRAGTFRRNWHIVSKGGQADAMVGAGRSAADLDRD